MFRRGALPLPQVDDFVVDRADRPADDPACQGPIEQSYDTAPPGHGVSDKIVREEPKMLPRLGTIFDHEPHRHHKYPHSTEQRADQSQRVRLDPGDGLSNLVCLS